MRIRIIAVSLAVMVCSCKKKVENSDQDMLTKTAATSTNKGEYIKYTILKGEQYCDKNVLKPISYPKLSFSVLFDSSAIYQSTISRNQGDINKLFGFSDNNAQHHVFSARFGWGWSIDSLRLYAYVYNNGTITEKELGTIEIGSANSCSIEVSKGAYIFSLNGKTEVMPRESTTVQAEGYKLYPYFGGEEPAPHTISIWIKELGVL